MIVQVFRRTDSINYQQNTKATINGLIIIIINGAEKIQKTQDRQEQGGYMKFRQETEANDDKDVRPMPRDGQKEEDDNVDEE